ncbi:MAG: GNAT family N-acetyltransferase [Spirochaetes bacterium]|nr:GNAT family N-acetyltransferase [Spirochaetota bacterium]
MLITRSHPLRVTEVALGKDAYTDRLYGHFRICNPAFGPFTSSRQLELVAGSGRTVTIQVPERMRIDIPADKKIAGTPLLRVRPIGRHLDAMQMITLRSGWNQTDADFSRITGFVPAAAFLANVVKGKAEIPVGCGVSVPVGKHHAWISIVAVVPEMRRQGIANEIMRACVTKALADGKIINGLDATPLGHTVYGTLGYKDAYRLWRSQFDTAEFANAAYYTEHIKPLLKKDYDEVARYDADKFLERHEILAALARDAIAAFVARSDNGDITGYVMARPGRVKPHTGPLIANDKDTARQLAAAVGNALHAKGFAASFIDTPDSAFADPGKFDPAAFDQPQKPSKHKIISSLTPIRNFTRMYQCVTYEDTSNLLAAYCVKEKIAKTSVRARAFETMLGMAVYNHSESQAFMRYERDVLQYRMWAISGAEKG